MRAPFPDPVGLRCLGALPPHANPFVVTHIYKAITFLKFRQFYSHKSQLQTAKILSILLPSLAHSLCLCSFISTGLAVALNLTLSQSTAKRGLSNHYINGPVLSKFHTEIYAAHIVLVFRLQLFKNPAITDFEYRGGTDIDSWLIMAHFDFKSKKKQREKEQNEHASVIKVKTDNTKVSY